MTRWILEIAVLAGALVVVVLLIAMNGVIAVPVAVIVVACLAVVVYLIAFGLEEPL